MTTSIDRPPSTRATLARSAASGALWNYGSLTWTKIAALATSIVLARTLTPAEFGVVSLAMVIVAYFDILNSFGISSAVVYESDDDDVTMSTAFWLTQGFGFAAFVATAASAPLTARLFNMPELLPIQVVLGFGFVLGSLGSVHDARLRRSLQWRKRMPADLTRSTIKSGGTIVLALAGLGAWALVWSQLAAVLVFSLLIIAIVRWRPSLRWSGAAAKRQISFGGHYSASLALGTVAKDIDYVFVGAVLTPSALGWYTMGFRLPDLAIMGIAWAASQTAFPVLARLRDDRAGLSNAVVQGQRLMAIATVPLAAALAVASAQIVNVAFGAEWAPTAAVMPFIALSACLKALTFIGGDALKATGRVKVLTVVAAIRLPITLIALVLAVPHGIVAVAATQAVLTAIGFVADLLLIRWFTGPAVSSMLAAFVGAVTGSAALVTAYLLVSSLGWSDVVTLVVGLSIGFALCALVIARLDGAALRGVRAALRPHPTTEVTA